MLSTLTDSGFMDRVSCRQPLGTNYPGHGTAAKSVARVTLNSPMAMSGLALHCEGLAVSEIDQLGL